MTTALPARCPDPPLPPRPLTLSMPIDTRRLSVLATLVISPWITSCQDQVDPTSVLSLPSNRAPTTFGAVPDQVLVVGQKMALPVSDYYRDPDGDPLSYSVISSDSEVVIAEATADTVSIRGIVEGSVLLTVTASDPAGLSVQRSVVVRVDDDPDRAALVALYEATDGPRWVRSDKWLTSAPLGEWHGVWADSRGRVVALDLTSGNIGLGLAGEIPADLAKLTSLNLLDLRGNDLTGEIPLELGNLTALEQLDLAGNRLTGSIPKWMGNLSKLKVLSLNHNDLTGGIPAELGHLADLLHLNLSYNQMEGSIPPELGNLSKLRVLWLHRNGLEGSIPVELANLGSVEWISLSHNQLTGPITPELPTGMSMLVSLNLDNNRITGPIPPALGQLPALQYVDLHDNDELCVPGTDDFGWFASLRRGSALWCNEADVAALEVLYDAAGGPGWRTDTGWKGGPVLGRWHGVETDSLGRVIRLDLSGNELSGRLAGFVGGLAQLRTLILADNPDLAGPFPVSLARLSLEVLDHSRTELCVPAAESFQAWIAGVPVKKGKKLACPHFTDREILTSIYHATSGSGWAQSDNWLTSVPIGKWHGVEVDSTERVVTLDLRSNGLVGEIPPELGQLTSLRRLRLGGNYNMKGPIPAELGNLTDLLELDLGFNTQLSGPIPSELGNLTSLERLNLRANRLTGPIPPQIGNLTRLKGLLLGSNELTGTIPPELSGLTQLEELTINSNRLTGPIPPALGSLIHLEDLRIGRNRLTGPIPPTLGNLTKLEVLTLNDNQLTGPIPPELGNLSRLWAWLSLENNQLTGPVPPELGNLKRLHGLWLGGNQLNGPIPPELEGLAGLEELYLDNNKLTGRIPPELGNLADLRELYLSDNQLEGSIPPELGDLARLTEVDVSGNSGLAGALPASLTALAHLERMRVRETGLCAAEGSPIRTWLAGVSEQAVPLCAASMVYLTQAVQSRLVPVPMVAGEAALLRVFIAAEEPGGAMLPSVRARFYLDGIETFVAEIPTGTHGLPTEIDEGTLDASVNAEVPGSVVQPGLEMVVEVDPDSILDPALGVPRRIPEEGRLSVEVQTVPMFDMTVIPFLWSEKPDSTILSLTHGMAADPQGHELLSYAVDVLPIGDFNVTAHAPVVTSRNDKSSLFSQTRAIRAMEGGSGYYMGMMSGPPSRGGRAGPGFGFSDPDPQVIAHELGHAFGLSHAPCGGAGYSDPRFPDPKGKIGDWGYAARPLPWKESSEYFAKGDLISPNSPDLMSYCSPEWISGYHFNLALRNRLQDDSEQAAALPRLPALLLWGGVDSTGTPYLEPAFVVDAPPSVPASGGEYELTGTDSVGAILFSLGLDMLVIPDADERSRSFAFALPVRPEWTGSLARLTLSGPDGTASLVTGTDRPMTIYRDSRTGQVRGMVRGDFAVDGNVRGLLGQPGLQVLRSRGIPSAETWRR